MDSTTSTENSNDHSTTESPLQKKLRERDLEIVNVFYWILVCCLFAFAAGCCLSVLLSIFCPGRPRSCYLIRSEVAMLVFACVAGAFILVCTLVAFIIPTGPTVTLSDVARQMETMHGSRPMKSVEIAGAEEKRKA